MNSHVESSITKLLLATKKLLEVLNGWSHGTIEEREVSDVYVRLGNEFNFASAAFLSERIDISDLISIPEDLRVILESTLSEEASPETLERYLPRIRSIIINLLQGLKRKQAEYRSRAERAYTTPYKQKLESIQHFSSHAISSPSDGSIQQKEQSLKSSIQDVHYPGSAEMTSTSSRNISSSFLTAHQTAEKSVPYDTVSSSPFSSPHPIVPTLAASSSDLSSPYPPSSANESTTSTHQWPKDRAFVPLQHDDVFEKSSSRQSSCAISRPSIDHISPLQNVSQTFTRDKKSDVLKGILEKNTRNRNFSQNNQSLSVSVHNDPYTESTSIHNSQVFFTPELSQNNIHYKSEPTTFTLFLQYGSQVKKIIHHKDITMDNLRALFIEKFKLEENNDSPLFYIQDIQTKILYELEDTKDIVDHSLISLRTQVEDIPKKVLEDELSSLTKEFQSLKTSIEGQKEMITEITSRPSTCLSKSTMEFFPKQENNILKTRENCSCIIKSIRDELKILRSVCTEFISMKMHVLDVDTKIKEIRNVTFKNSENSRSFIELGKKKLEAETQSLVTKIENLSDLVGSLRIDVINKKARPSPQQLNNVREEEAQIQKDMISLINHLESLSPCWRQLWETELQNVVEEQEFLAHQENFIEDLKSDINSTMEIFGNIVTYSEYQEKGIPRSSHSITTNNSTDSLSTLNSEIQNIKSDQDTKKKFVEKEGKKDTHYTFYIDKFKNELNEFITETKFKKTGCMEDIERFRKEKDDDHLKEIYSLIKQSKKDTNSHQDEIIENNSSELVEAETISSNGNNPENASVKPLKDESSNDSILISEVSDQLKTDS
ncbi:hypothetical protein PORY_001503 [Pneumocystis oryctolagi]|uniref:Uncharacterized protein n=1 Tax=Pneumocystis oryctolagi TaxID=42067 RepID=A0ACB7CEG4_9ASCO|nr:hypothetical protein PORY_001503 [Pneumocystis oryctolagi]